MTIDGCPASVTTPAGIRPVDHAAQADELIMGLVREPWGQVSPSVYETARLVALSPWLTGHAERVAYLLGAQRPDGGWGGPGGYALVPTLSAVDALLSVLRHRSHGAGRRAIARSADRGLRMLCVLATNLRTGDGTGGVSAMDVPDMPAVDIIAASLTTSIEEHLRTLRHSPPEGQQSWPLWTVPALLGGLGRERLDLVRAALKAGVTLPEKVFHALEVAGEAAAGAPGVPPAATGTVGASPAATAAWLGERGAREPGHPARRFLEKVVRRQDGPVPCGIPITVFERSWVIGSLLRAGLSPTVPAEITAGLAAALGPDGTPASAGLPADADTTAMTLYSLSLLGVKRSPDALLRYETDTHFCTWPGEDGHSASVNAHVLDAFGEYLRYAERYTCADQSDVEHRFVAVVRKLSSWLCGEQRRDGSWHDRWHASPYYATACCVLALSDFGVGDAASAVDRAVAWVLATQRPDGSWGVWESTAEETAYALKILLLARPVSDLAIDRAVAKGHRHLLGAARRGGRPALWHDKDLYLPAAVVDAEILAVLHLAALRQARRTPSGRPQEE
ncbi:prenyltransferase/squalene oxidase repeat-containing protein [Actinomadura madurae]|uniref:prenyltransferase/squalene oxidase repeat-containing protein n=1 Tax=Actinomadura madurae TaxID=1993 RepID=UPI000D8FF231|nr:prenyltransferase/squalene oxidase repeat-containing protein [Actinomadura madurae]SPT59916.1 Squalene--hopene cyclase [Actinomadura madurae]